MLAFRRVDDRVVCQFEPAELSLLSGLISQLIELLLESSPPAGGPGTGLAGHAVAAGGHVPFSAI